MALMLAEPSGISARPLNSWETSECDPLFWILISVRSDCILSEALHTMESWLSALVIQNICPMGRT